MKVSRNTLGNTFRKILYECGSKQCLFLAAQCFTVISGKGPLKRRVNVFEKVGLLFSGIALVSSEPFAL